MNPLMITIVYPGKEIALSDTFLSLGELFPFLDLRSEGLSSLASLGRHLSFFSTIAESENLSLGKKSSSSFVFRPRTHVWHHGGIYIPFFSKTLIFYIDSQGEVQRVSKRNPGRVWRILKGVLEDSKMIPGGFREDSRGY